MFNPFAPLMAIVIPLMLFSALMVGLSKINNKDSDIWFKVKRKQGTSFIGIKIIPLIMVIWMLYVYFDRLFWVDW